MLDTAVPLTVNGEACSYRGAGETPLLWVLRDALGLKGTKYGCGVGVCGACIVLVEGEPRHACTLAVSDVSGKAITTIEGLAAHPRHPVIQAWIGEQVAQCGYCQPAQVLTASWLLARHPRPTEAEIDAALSPVLCRCGTYSRIRRAVHRATDMLAGKVDDSPFSTAALCALPAMGIKDEGHAFNPWLRIADNGAVTVTIDRAEMGQGAMTGLVTLLAEELEVDLDRVRVQFAPASDEYSNPLIGEQSTGGSTSIRAGWKTLRSAGASARAQLIAAAARIWGVEPGECYAKRGEVVHGATRRRIRYGALAAAAAALAAPRRAPLKPSDRFRLIGRSLPRIEMPDLVLGRAVYAIDVAPPGLLHAVIARCPSFGGRIASGDASQALRIAGVRHVVSIGDNAIAVVAENVPAALKGRDALRIAWDTTHACTLDSAAVSERLGAALERPGKTVHEEGNVVRALKLAQRVVEARYGTPYLAHATMEPMNCIAEVRDDGCDIWAGTQAQQEAQRRAMALTGLPRAQVHVHTTYLGGGFGRRLESDFVAEAVEVAKVVHRPVQVLWTRADDLQHDFYRPASATAFRAGIDKNGEVLAWEQRIAGPALALDGVDMPYAIPHVREIHVEEDPGVPTGPWRSVGASQNAYTIECFADELAAATGKDPLAFRLALLSHAPRHRAVLELAAERAGWSRTLPAGKGRGIAVYRCFGSWVAQVAEVSVAAGVLRVERIVCAADCGVIVNPDAVAAQMEGGVIFGLSAALHGRVTLHDGAVTQSGFDDYPIVTLRDAPAIEVHLVRSRRALGGAGEPGVPPVAPAVANAVFAATGRRIRRLPLLSQPL